MKRSAVLALAACGCIDVKVDVPLVCATAREVVIDSPLAGVSTEFTDEPLEVNTEVVQDRIDGFPEGLTTSVSFFDGTLTPQQGGDLSFVEKVRIHLAPQEASADHPDIDLFAYRRDPASRTPDILVQGFDEPVDLGAYLSSGSAVFGFELTAEASDFPDQVTFDAEFCFSAELDFHHDLLPQP